MNMIKYFVVVSLLFNYVHAMQTNEARARRFLENRAQYARWGMFFTGATVHMALLPLYNPDLANKYLAGVCITGGGLCIKNMMQAEVQYNAIVSRLPPETRERLEKKYKPEIVPMGILACAGFCFAGAASARLKSDSELALR